MKILALGIGNVMFSDEGVGVHLCRFLENNYLFDSTEHTLDFVDGGTLAQRLIPIIAQYDYVIVFDCVDVDSGEIGDVFFFDFENVPDGVTWQGSAHEVEMLQTLKMMDMVGDRPKTQILGIVPKVISDTTFSLSDEIKKGSLLMEKVFIDHIKNLGFEVTKIDYKNIQEIANSSCTVER